MWVVIPVKPFAYAKQRLAALLRAEERALLARVMLEDLLATVAACPGVTGTLLVGQPEAMGELAQRAHCEVLAEAERGLSRAVAQAASHLAGRGVSRMLMLPGDVPLASPSEIEAIIASHHGDSCMTIVADREGYGTNALAVTLPCAIQFQFGRESFSAHCAVARAAGLAVRVLDLPGISFDLDTPEDLSDLMSYETPARTPDFLATRGLTTRPEARLAW